MPHPDADPTSALAMIRVVILEWENAEADHIPATGVLAYLVDKLDISLCRRGAFLPSQWTGPEGKDWQGYNRWTPAEVTDPDKALEQIRILVDQVQWAEADGKSLPDIPDQLFPLVAALDKLATDEQAVPRRWLTTG